MSSITDFLFEGKPPKSVTTYGQTVQNVPQWMSDYTQGLMARANAVAAEPYTPYGGPRIAGFSPAQEAAFGLAEQNVGSYQPYMEGAAKTATAAGNTSPLEAAQPYLNQAAGSWTDPGNVSSYMNPYIDNVLNRNTTLAQRNLTEKFLPQLQKTFAGAGQLGSRGGVGSMEEVGIRGVRDISEGLNEQNLAALSSAYGQAADIYGTDQSRKGTLAQTAGGLENAAGNLRLGASQQFGTLAGNAQQYGNVDAAALEAVGKARQGMTQSSYDLAYKDFQDQLNYPKTQTEFMSNIVRGLPASAVPTTTNTQDYGPSSVYQPSGLAQIAGAYGAYKGLTSARGGYIRRFAKGGVVRGGLELVLAA